MVSRVPHGSGLTVQGAAAKFIHALHCYFIAIDQVFNVVLQCLREIQV